MLAFQGQMPLSSPPPSSPNPIVEILHDALTHLRACSGLSPARGLEGRECRSLGSLIYISGPLLDVKNTRKMPDSALVAPSLSYNPLASSQFHNQCLTDLIITRPGRRPSEAWASNSCYPNLILSLSNVKICFQVFLLSTL